MLLKDKKVLITGAGRGIGRQITITMAEEGAVVLAAAHSEKNLRELICLPQPSIRLHIRTFRNSRCHLYTFASH